jgi:3-phenylpropionate/trans-cinnamate dioxygenase ferredoxin reductase component
MDRSVVAAGVLIVGGGQAAVQIAVSLRELGWQAPITIATGEAHAPYQRPPLSKAFLSGDADVTSLAFRSDDFYERERITLLRSHRIVDLARAAPGRPGIATTADGKRLTFDHLALATGARPRRLRVPGSDLAGICYLRDVSHAIELRNRLTSASRVLVVGGGFIGLEAAAAARAKGKEVTVVEATDRLIGRVVAPIVSDFYYAAHQRRGTTIALGAAVSGFDGTDGVVTGAHLSNGKYVPADVVVVGIGAEPRVELAEELGLKCAGGIVVDSCARTSDPTIVAAGDCAITPHPGAVGRAVRLESVGHAIEHAKCAAATLAGAPVPYDAVPWFWSDQGTLKLQIAGLSSGFDQTVVRGDPEAEKFSVFYYREGRLLAVHAVNSPRDYLAVRRALTAGQQITPEGAANHDSPLRAVNPASSIAEPHG